VEGVGATCADVAMRGGDVFHRRRSMLGPTLLMGQRPLGGGEAPRRAAPNRSLTNSARRWSRPGPERPGPMPT